MTNLIEDFLPVLVLGIETSLSDVSRDKYIIQNVYSKAYDTVTERELLTLKALVLSIEELQRSPNNQEVIAAHEKAYQYLADLGERGGELYLKFID